MIEKDGDSFSSFPLNDIDSSSESDNASIIDVGSVFSSSKKDTLDYSFTMEFGDDLSTIKISDNSSSFLDSKINVPYPGAKISSTCSFKDHFITPCPSCRNSTSLPTVISSINSSTISSSV